MKDNEVICGNIVYTKPKVYAKKHHHTRASVWSRSIDAKREGGEALGSNRNGNVETDQGADTKEQRKRSGEMGMLRRIKELTLRNRGSGAAKSRDIWKWETSH